MEEIFAKNVTPKSLVGYSEVWYSSKRKMHKWIKIPEDAIKYAMYFPRFNGVQIGSKESENFSWRPFVGAYHTDGYLVGASIVIINELKRQDAVGLNSFPKYVVSVLSQSKESLASTATKLKLSLENLV